MASFDGAPNRFDLPISSVRSQSRTRTRVETKLDEMEELELSDQDQGFLRLARLLIGFEPQEAEPLPDFILEDEDSDWDDGLFS